MVTPIPGIISTYSGNTGTSPANPWKHLVAPGRNRAVLVICAIRGGKTLTGVTVGATSGTVIGNYGTGNDNNTRRVAMAIVVAPATGDLTVTPEFSASGTANGYSAWAMSLTDVNQSTPNDTPNGQDLNATLATLNTDIDSTAGDLVVDVLCYSRNDAVAGSGQTSRARCNGTPPGIISYKVATGDPTNMSWSWTSQNSRYGHMGVAIIGDDTGDAVGPAEPSTRGKGSWWLGARPEGDTHAAGSTMSIPVGSSNANQGSSTAGNGSRTRVYKDGNLSLPGLLVISNATSASSTATLHKNGSATSVSITISAGATGVIQGTGDVDVVAGDELDWSVVTGTGGTLAHSAIWLWFDPDGADTIQPIHWQSNGQPMLSASTTYYAAPQGLKGYSTGTASDVPAPIDMVLENWDVTYVTTTRTFDIAVTSRKNGSAGSLSLSWPFGDDTALKTQYSGSDTLSTGDTFGYQVTTTSGSNTAEIGNIVAWGRSSVGEAMFMAARARNGYSFNQGTTLYVGIQGELGSSTTESHVQYRAPKAMTLLRLYALTTLNTLAFGSEVGDVQVILRVNGVDTDLQLRIAKSDPERYWIDMQNAVEVDEGDLISLKVITPATSASSWSAAAMGVVMVEALASVLPTLGTVSATAITSSGFRPNVTYTY